MQSDFLPAALFILVSLVVAIFLLLLGLVINPSNAMAAKTAAFECGFPAFSEARMPFDVRFYLVAIVFIIFDLETAFLFPWAVAFREIGAFGFMSMVLFLSILMVGFAYEWRKGAFEWG